MPIHVSELVDAGSIESTLRQAAAFGLCVDANFATDVATTLANLAARNAALLAGNGDPKLLPLYYSMVEAVKRGYYTGGLDDAVMNADLATIYAAVDGTWEGGFGYAI